MFKKALSLLLALMLIVTSVSITAISVTAAEGDEEPVATVVSIAGDNPDLFAANWTAGEEADTMTANEDGTYTKVYENVGPFTKVTPFKVVDGDQWIGTPAGYNMTIDPISEPTDITIKYDPNAEGRKVTVSGNGVKEHVFNASAVEKMVAVGAGQGEFLNGVAWDPASELNEMTKIADGVYEITYEDVESAVDLQVKFAANGSWVDNFGAGDGDVAVGTPNAAQYDGGNIKFDVPEDESTVTLTLDMSQFDTATENYVASYTIKVVGPSGEVTTPVAEPTTAAPAEETTAAPVAEETTVPAAAGDKLTVKATSNIFPTVSKTFDPDTKQITVTWWTQMTDKAMINGQWTITYDNTKLTPDMTDGVNRKTNPRTGAVTELAFRATNGVATVVNYNPDSLPGGGIKGNASSLSGYELCTEEGERTPFISVTFNPVEGAAGETVVNLDVEISNVQGMGDVRDVPWIQDSEIVDRELGYLPTNTPAAVYAGPIDPNHEEEEVPTTEPVVTTAEPTTAEPTTAEPTTAEPTTAEPTTAAPEPTTAAPVVDKFLTVNGVTNNAQYIKGTSNSYYGDNIPEQVVVSFYINTPDYYQMVNGQFTVEFDPAVLQTTEALNKNGRKNTLMPAATATDGTSTASNFDNAADGKIQFNFSNINDGGVYLTDESGNQLAVAQVVFNVVGEGETDVFFDTEVMTFNKYGEEVDSATWFDMAKWEDDYAENLAKLNENAAPALVIMPEGQQPPVPTTAEPTTVPAEPTTVPAEPTTEPVSDVTYVVVGSSNFIASGWDADPEMNVMTKNEDGTYSITINDVVAEEGKLYQTKVVEFPGPVWHGMDGTDLNVDFMMSADGDVTVTYNPETLEITVTGPTVIPPVYDIKKITAAGTGQNNFLNGIAWDPAAEDNQLTEVEPGLYEITFEDVETNLEYQVKFCANGSWDMNWGFDKNGEDVVLGQAMPAAYNGDNAKFTIESEEEEVNVKLTLDLRNWDSMKKGGATYTIEVVQPVEPTTEPEPTTVPAEPTTEPAPAQLHFSVLTKVDGEHIPVMPKDFAFAGEEFTVNVGDTVTFAWKLDTDGNQVEAVQWNAEFAPEFFEISADNTLESVMPQIVSGSELNITENAVLGNASNINGYDVDPAADYIVIKAKAVAAGETEVNMTLDELAYKAVVEPTTEPAEPTTVPAEPTTEPAEPTTEPAQPTTAPAEPTTEPAQPTTVPAEPTTEPAEPTTEPAQPTTAEPTSAPVEPTTAEPTTTPVVEPTTVAPTTVAPTTTPDATSVTQPTTTKAAADTATPSSASTNGTVKTGDASMAVIILLVLVSATAAIFFTRRRERK